MIKGKNISLRLVELNDATFILGLRSDPTLNQYLHTTDASVQAQTEWLTNYKIREKDQKEYYFIIQDNMENAIGTVRLYGFHEDSFCWGSWILSSKAPLTAAIESALLVYEHAFTNLRFNSSHFDVRKKNVSVARFHINFGAKIVKEDDQNLYFVFNKDAYTKARTKYGKFIRPV